MDDVIAEASHLIGQQIERMIDAKFRELEARIERVDDLDEDRITQIIVDYIDTNFNVEDTVREVLSRADFEVTVSV